MLLESTFLVNPLIVLREEFDDWAVLFDPDSGNAYGLDPTGVFIWKKIDGNNTVADIVSSIKSDFDDVSDDVENEVESFLQELEEKGYITNA